MNADLPPDEPCHRCLGSGSGIYNALSPKSTCEACEGTGLREDPRVVATATVASEAIAHRGNR